MRFKSQWPGDAIASPICNTYDLEDSFFEDLGDTSWGGVDRRSDEGDAERIAGVLEYGVTVNLAPGSSAPSSQRRLQPASVDTETAPTDTAGWRAWITSIASIVAELWSRMLREREIRRITVAWEMIDDRTLKDIGISCYEIEYARDARHWS
jgi:uncharacterized protein YjiS (DUF1127 family)